MGSKWPSGFPLCLTQLLPQHRLKSPAVPPRRQGGGTAHGLTCPVVNVTDPKGPGGKDLPQEGNCRGRREKKSLRRKYLQ